MWRSLEIGSDCIGRLVRFVAKWIFRSYPHSIKAGDLVSIDGVGERPSSNAIDIAALVNEAACGCDGILRV